MKPIELAFHTVYIAFGVFAIAVRRPWLHFGVACGIALTFVAYIALLFARL